MSIFKVATVLVCLTSVLTSTVNGNSTSNENSSSPGLKRIFGTSNPSNGSATSQEHGTPVDIMSEAGPMVGSSAITSKGVIKSYGKPLAVGPKDVSQPDENPVSLLASDVGSKVSQIKARKGVGNETETIGREGVVRFSTEAATDIPKTGRESLRENVNDDKTSAATPGPRTVATESIVNKNKTSDSKTPEKDKADNRLDQVTRLPIMMVPGRGNKTAIHIPKPTVTSGEGNDDGEGMPSSATQTEFGMPKKVDYVIPVVITIMATPVLGIAAYILYTRGRDCWDKRHYRRMDFLIDGMYND